VASVASAASSNLEEKGVGPRTRLDTSCLT
jgi:hypothetical protein